GGPAESAEEWDGEAGFAVVDGEAKKTTAGRLLPGIRFLEALSTTRPGARKALGLAGPANSTVSSGPRGARSHQADDTVEFAGPISESETAFPAVHGQANARAAQRRPGAEHLARPGLPDTAFHRQAVRVYPRA